MNSPSIIIFEGCDSSGKTTLLNHFNNRLDSKCMTYKATKSIYDLKKFNFELSIQYDWKCLFDFMSQMSSPDVILFDRSFISQWVYSNTFRRKSIIENYDLPRTYDEIFIDYCRILNSFNYIIVYCEREDYSSVTDDESDMTKSSDIKHFYHEFFNKIANVGGLSKSSILSLKFEDGIQHNISALNDMMHMKGIL